MIAHDTNPAAAFSEWPDTPTSNALLDHFCSQFGFSTDEGVEATMGVLDVLKLVQAQEQGV